ncbi:flagellar motor protein MotB [Paenibacillus rhizoplanae]
MRQRNRRQRRAAAGKESRDRWMITYADLITLLLIFFVILYAMSSLDSQKYAIVSGSLSDTFKNGSKVLEGGSGVLEGHPGITGTDVSKGPNEDGGTAGGPSATGSANADGLNATGQTGDGAGHQPSARELAFSGTGSEAGCAYGGVITQYVEENNLGEQIFLLPISRRALPSR